MIRLPDVVSLPTEQGSGIRDQVAWALLDASWFQKYRPTAIRLALVSRQEEKRLYGRFLLPWII